MKIQFKRSPSTPRVYWAKADASIVQAVVFGAQGPAGLWAWAVWSFQGKEAGVESSFAQAKSIAAGHVEMYLEKAKSA